MTRFVLADALWNCWLYQDGACLEMFWHNELRGLEHGIPSVWD